MDNAAYQQSEDHMAAVRLTVLRSQILPEETEDLLTVPLDLRLG